MSAQPFFSQTKGCVKAMSLTSGSKAGGVVGLKGFMACKLRALRRNEIDQCQIRKGPIEALCSENPDFSANARPYACVYHRVHGPS